MKRMREWSQAKKILYGILAVYLLGLIGFAVGFGIKGHKNESFKVIDCLSPRNLVPHRRAARVRQGRAVSAARDGASRSESCCTSPGTCSKRPGRLQVAVEMGYNLMSR